MSDIKKHEPLWGTWQIESLLGEGSYGKVYKVSRREFGKTYYSAVKIISVPRNETELHELKSEELLNDSSLREFLFASVKDIVTEIDLLREFQGNSNIVNFQDHMIVERTDGIGWDILIRMELLTSLFNHMAQAPLSQEEIVKLGIHICRALELCARKSIIHRDIKPGNIFISEYGEYKLGDFGIARRLERTMSATSKIGTHVYMAPEVFKGEPYDAGADIYSLGIVMYRLLNQNRIPFMPEYPNPVNAKDRDNALKMRMNRESFPSLKGVSPELNALILKACAYNPDARFSGPAEMREALESITGAMECAPGVMPIMHNAPVQAEAEEGQADIPVPIPVDISALSRICPLTMTVSQAQRKA
jgi:serine/threonine-protein kinase